MSVNVNDRGINSGLISMQRIDRITCNELATYIAMERRHTSDSEGSEGSKLTRDTIVAVVDDRRRQVNSPLHQKY